MGWTNAFQVCIKQLTETGILNYQKVANLALRHSDATTVDACSLLSGDLIFLFPVAEAGVTGYPQEYAESALFWEENTICNKGFVVLI